MVQCSFRDDLVEELDRKELLGWRPREFTGRRSIACWPSAVCRIRRAIGATRLPSQGERHNGGERSRAFPGMNFGERTRAFPRMGCAGRKPSGRSPPGDGWGTQESGANRVTIVQVPPARNRIRPRGPARSGDGRPRPAAYRLPIFPPGGARGSDDRMGKDLLLAIDQGTTGSHRARHGTPRAAPWGRATHAIPAALPRAGPGRARRRRDLAERARLGEGRARRGGHRRLRAHRGHQHHQPARDHAGVGALHRPEPIRRAIVWQDRRTTARCAELRAAGHEDRVRAPPPASCSIRTSAAPSSRGSSITSRARAGAPTAAS